MQIIVKFHQDGGECWISEYFTKNAVFVDLWLFGGLLLPLDISVMFKMSFCVGIHSLFKVFLKELVSKPWIKFSMENSVNLVKILNVVDKSSQNGL